MDKSFHTGNRERLYAAMKPASLLVMFAGTDIRKTNDEYYPFYTERNFYYLTGLDSHEFVLLAVKDASGAVSERIYILPPDPMEERWTGRRIKPQEAEALSGIRDVRYVAQFEDDFHALAAGGHYSAATGSFGQVYLDLFRVSPKDIDRPAHHLLRRIQSDYPFLAIENANAILRRLRLIKQPCEITAIRQAEKVTGEGILAMMKASKPGMYEYQYKAEFDRVLGWHSPQGPAFPSIISAGRNNFCIHYYSYTGQAMDGDMILNDVGAQHDSLMTDVSRGWPCNGRFTEKQKLLYECALATSNHMFSIIRPGMPMADVDGTIRRYNASLLCDAGVLDKPENISRYMWHGGAHHVGYDVHDVVERPEVIAPGMVFCVDVGIYHEEWGIGFRLEDNCLVTEEGCENLSAAIPRTVEDIEDVMCKK
ncbi:MAG: aminopeptidase P N-terminal domain-containing protein [Clostridia bacterium]|nr:aminopeptidase P N-terminal domain-containing protein [Clostridia bacterium]